jgi:hypothetical protein
MILVTWGTMQLVNPTTWKCQHSLVLGSLMTTASNEIPTQHDPHGAGKEEKNKIF